MKDTDHTPPHGIRRPSPHEVATGWLNELRASFAYWTPTDDEDHPDREPVDAIASAVGLVESMAHAYFGLDPEGVDILAHACAAFCGWRPCAYCDNLTAPGDLTPTADGLACSTCLTDDPDDLDYLTTCEGCGRLNIPLDPEGWAAELCAECEPDRDGDNAYNLGEIPGTQPHALRPDFGRGLLTDRDDTPSPFGGALD